MNRQLLESPFPPEQIKSREGKQGKMLDYIAAHAVIQRLNDAFDGQWSFEIISHEILDNEVLVLGQLTAEGITKTAFGNSSITRAKETKAIISLGDDLKSAATDALKKAATMFGVGLHLYSGQAENKQQASNKQDAKGTKTSTPRNGGNGSNGGSNGGSIGNGSNGNGRLSSKQFSFLMKLINERGMTKRELNDKCVEQFGVVAEHLSNKDASSLIENFLAH